MPAGSPEPLTSAQQELYEWLADYIGSHHHSPSIRQMMQAMGLRSPAPVQSRLRHLQQKGWITWQEGQARTLQLLGGVASGIPVLGAVAAGGLVETFEWYAIPAGMFVHFAMMGLELMAEEIEDPFGLDCNDLPTGTLAHTIKNNVYEILSLYDEVEEKKPEPLLEKIF